MARRGGTSCAPLPYQRTEPGCIGTIFGDEKRPSQPVPALIINGMRDQNVRPEGGPPRGRGANAWEGTPARPAVDQAAFWAEANGCKKTPFYPSTCDTAPALDWRPINRAVEHCLPA
jgi:poly(3-hydroxybutyrate) depolymerase